MIDKLDGMSKDLVKENIEKLKELFLTKTYTIKYMKNVAIVLIKTSNK